VSDESLPTHTGQEASAKVDLENDLLGEPQTLPSNIGLAKAMIPPRALEITWPDTRNLKHCLGHNIDIKIKVDADGSILSAEAVGAGHPADCVRAALESAKRIVFEPGLIGGRPAAMWTQVRIDFRKKK
jgi:hypothetical protein